MPEWVRTTFDLESITTAKWIITGAVLVAVFVLRALALRLVRRRFEEVTFAYRARKIVSYISFLVVVVVMANIWIEGEGLTTYLGLLSAGLAIALADVLKNLAGWFYIVLRRPFRIGDRVEIGAHAGDIVDFRAFRFSMLEIKNWVGADQSTGRIIHVPNGLVFTTPIANYTEGFSFVWHEIPVLVTFESDWSRAEEIVLDAVSRHAQHHDAERAQAEIRDASYEYSIRYTHLTPTVYLTVKESGVLLTGRLLVEARQRRQIEGAVWRTVLERFAAEPQVQLAYPTIRAYLPGVIEVEQRQA